MTQRLMRQTFEALLHRSTMSLTLRIRSTLEMVLVNRLHRLAAHNSHTTTRRRATLESPTPMRHHHNNIVETLAIRGPPIRTTSASPPMGMVMDMRTINHLPRPRLTSQDSRRHRPRPFGIPTTTTTSNYPKRVSRICESLMAHTRSTRIGRTS